ncbi:hypothetical protein JZ751_022033 [Albula glossodonta]|uniref:Chemokine interleukin-8-like domain-containing protein n=1 Tax=Albula glossodonta TaxID=121402 RepID=A0A8T2NRE0_9TELE|nr:hypothetical protein JZ751_022033 [Albula glossodonta]
MKLSYAAVLLFLCAATQDLRVSASSMSILNCCLKVSETRPCTENIIRYTVQKVGLCPVDAIVFSTQRGMKVCANPEKVWVKKAMEEVDKRGNGQMKGKGKKGARKGKKGRKCRKGKRTRREGRVPFLTPTQNVPTQS